MGEVAAESSRMMRFAAVSAAGGVLDYAFAGFLIFLGAPDLIALLAGMALAGGLSFVAHEFWTFRAEQASKRHERLVRWLLLVVALLALRFVVLSGAAALLPPGKLWRLGALAFAFGASMAMNYLVSKFLVFPRAADAPGA